MCPLLKDPKVVKFLNQQIETTPSTSSVVIEELPNTTVGVLTVAAITRSKSTSVQSTPDVTPVTTDWTAEELLRDQMMQEVRQLQAELETTTSTKDPKSTEDLPSLDWDADALPQQTITSRDGPDQPTQATVDRDSDTFCAV
jgi:hypothetical protein